MISLPNGCNCSELTVNPKNWQTGSAVLLKKNWHIQYYFYDQAFRSDPKYKYGKLVLVKGMNRFKTLQERRTATKQLIDNELANLRDKGYNPITNQFNLTPASDSEIEPNIGFITALRKALDKLSIENTTLIDVRSAIKFIETAATQLGIANIEIQQIRRKHIKLVLERCGKIKSSWSASNFNHYRAYLMMLFKELLEHDAVDINPVKEISKQKEQLRLRETLSASERKKIDHHLLKVNPDFRRAVHIFFHSAGRRTELTRLKVSDVCLKKQFFKLLIKKGNVERYVRRPIKNISLDFWRQQLQHAQPDHYVFSVGFKPGKMALRPERFTKAWKKHVKEELGIDIDFYSLKHLNLDETASLLSIEDASKMADHQSTVITMKHYAMNEQSRQNEKLKKVKNSFA